MASLLVAEVASLLAAEVAFLLAAEVPSLLDKIVRHLLNSILFVFLLQQNNLFIFIIRHFFLKLARWVEVMQLD